MAPESSANYDIPQGHAEWVEAIRAYGNFPTREYDRYQLGHMHVDNQRFIKPTYLYPDKTRASTIYVNFNRQFYYSLEPEWNVFVPVDLYRESEQSIRTTIESIYEAAENGAGEVEVLLWANSRPPLVYSKDSDSLEPSIKFLSATNQVYDDFVQMCKRNFGTINPSKIHILTAQDFLFADEGLNELRLKGTDAIVDSIRSRRLSVHQPIVYLDADTTYIGTDTIPDMLEVLRSGKAHIAHARLEFTADEHSNHAKPLKEADRINDLYCMARFALDSNLDATDPRLYHEEVGTAFTARTWLHAGGVSVLDPEIGQNRSFIDRAVQALGKDVPPVYYVDGWIGTSSRRFRRLAASLLAFELPLSEYGDLYYNSRDVDDKSQRTRRKDCATEEEVYRMLHIMEQRQIELTGDPNKGYTPEQRSMIAQQIVHYALARGVS